jgi:ankyrin repeat protein
MDYATPPTNLASEQEKKPNTNTINKFYIDPKRTNHDEGHFFRSPHGAPISTRGTTLTQKEFELLSSNEPQDIVSLLMRASPNDIQKFIKYAEDHDDRLSIKLQRALATVKLINIYVGNRGGGAVPRNEKYIISQIRQLTSQAANVNLSGRDGWTALHLAAQFGSAEVVKTLLEQGADVNLGDSDGRTALHLAAQFGSAEVMKTLLEQGADVNLKTKSGWTAAYHLARSAPLLPPVKTRGWTRRGWTALHFAVARCLVFRIATRRGDAEVVKTLLEQGADVNLGATDGRTPLDLAAGATGHYNLRNKELRNTLHPYRQT